MQRVGEQQQAVARVTIGHEHRSGASTHRAAAEDPATGVDSACRACASTATMHSCNSGIGSGRRLLRSVYGKLNRTTCSPRLRSSADSASTPRSLMFPPAPCANRNAAGASPVVAGSNAAVTVCSPTGTVHEALRCIGAGLSLAELPIRAQMADRFLLQPGRLAQQREVVVRFAAGPVPLQCSRYMSAASAGTVGVLEHDRKVEQQRRVAAAMHEALPIDGFGRRRAACVRAAAGRGSCTRRRASGSTASACR